MINIKANYLYFLIAKLYHNFFFFLVSWFDFLISLSKFNYKKIIIYHNSIYHFKSFERKKFNFYIQLVSEKFFVIKINLNSKFMKFILIKFLEIKKISKQNKISINKDINLNFIKKRIFWDKFNKSNFANLKYLKNINSRKDYLDKFNMFIENNKNYIKLYDEFSLFKYNYIKGFLTNEICWDDWIYSNYALKYNKFVIFPESPQLGFTYYLKNTELKNSKLHQIISEKKYSKKQIRQSNLLINKLVSLKTSNSPLYYMKDYKKKNHISLKTKFEYSFIYFSNVFVDGPNYGVQDESFSDFIDYFDNFLFVLEHCVKYKIPLYIKLHPLTLKYMERKKYSHETYFYNCLLNIIDNKKKNYKSIIEIIDGSLENSNFKVLKKPIALTPRSNVSIEMGYLGIPCITFFDNYWKQFSFAKKTSKLPKNKNEFDKIYKSYNKSVSKNDSLKVYSFLIENSKRNIFSKKNFRGEISKINLKNTNNLKTIIKKL